MTVVFFCKKFYVELLEPLICNRITTLTLKIMQTVKRVEKRTSFNSAKINSAKSKDELFNLKFSNDPTAGSPTVTLLRLVLPLNDQV